MKQVFDYVILWDWKCTILQYLLPIIDLINKLFILIRMNLWACEIVVYPGEK